MKTLILCFSLFGCVTQPLDTKEKFIICVGSKSDCLQDIAITCAISGLMGNFHILGTQVYECGRNECMAINYYCEAEGIDE